MEQGAKEKAFSNLQKAASPWEDKVKITLGEIKACNGAATELKF